VVTLSPSVLTGSRIASITSPEAASAAAHIDGQLARGRQQVKELRQVKLPEVIIKFRRPGPADPGVRACPPGLTQVHPASLA
jgi:hypothetical protein